MYDRYTGRKGVALENLMDEDWKTALALHKEDIPKGAEVYGIDLTGEPYHNDVINIDVDVDSVEEYQKEKTDSAVESFVDEIQEVLNKYQRKLIF